MKKNITINLCGRLFQIDEDACEMLQHYIESLRSSFGRQEGGDEIVDDIEARIAELFDELRQQGAEAINIDHVKDIITRIGEPEQLAGEDSNAANESKSGHRYDSARSAAQGIMDDMRARTAGKKLFRNPKDKMVAGVLSGFAAYTNTDPVIWRVLMVLLFFFYGVGLVAYIVLALILPEAKTPEQLLQMEGKDLTPQNLADVVVGDVEPKSYSLARRLFSLVLKVIMAFFVGLVALYGLALLISLVLAIVAIVCAFTLPAAADVSLPFGIDRLQLLLNFSDHPWVVATFIGALLLMLFIPLYAIGHMLLTRAGKTAPMGIGQRIMWVVLWVVALCCLIPSIFKLNERYEEEYNANYKRTHTYQGVVMNNRDKDFLRQGGWTLLKAENCGHYSESGEYYNGDFNERYLDAYNENCSEIYQVERKEPVEPGVYRLDCIARAEGPGTFIYAIADETHLKQIPVYGDKGGELATIIQQQLPDSLTGDTFIKINERTIRVTDEMMQSQRVRDGLGWSPVSIENIVVKGDSIAYGVSTDAQFTSQPCSAKWFSATDFKLTRTGDLPKTNKK